MQGKSTLATVEIQHRIDSGSAREAWLWVGVGVNALTSSGKAA